MSTLPVVLERVQSLSHAIFTTGTYNLNIIGIRTDDNQANTFNDRLCLVYRDKYGWVTRTWAITTDPGTYWRQNPMRIRGTAIMAPGQYRGSHRIGLHRGRYPALVQTGGPVQYFRDANRDAILDMEPDTLNAGYAGLNIHRSSSRDGGSDEVQQWSAGCQVFQDPGEYHVFISICKRAADSYGNRFTYTLIDE